MRREREQAQRVKAKADSAEVIALKADKAESESRADGLERELMKARERIKPLTRIRGGAAQPPDKPAGYPHGRTEEGKAAYAREQLVELHLGEADRKARDKAAAYIKYGKDSPESRRVAMFDAMADLKVKGIWSAGMQAIVDKAEAVMHESAPGVPWVKEGDDGQRLQ